VDDGDEAAEVLLEGRVEVLRAADSNEAVGVGELGEDADVVVVLELGLCGGRKTQRGCKSNVDGTGIARDW